MHIGSPMFDRAQKSSCFIDSSAEAWKPSARANAAKPHVATATLWASQNAKRLGSV